MDVLRGCFGAPAKLTSPFGEFLTYLIFTLSLAKPLSAEFERVAAMLMLLNTQALVQLLLQSWPKQMPHQAPRTHTEFEPAAGNPGSALLAVLLHRFCYFSHERGWRNGRGEEQICSPGAGGMTGHCREAAHVSALAAAERWRQRRAGTSAAGTAVSQCHLPRGGPAASTSGSSATLLQGQPGREPSTATP